MAQHKWHKEIKAWADGAEIEWRYSDTECWMPNCNNNPVWHNDEYEYRIKPQPKKPQYLYAHRTNEGDITFEFGKGVVVVGYEYIGKIKLEAEYESTNSN